MERLSFTREKGKEKDWNDDGGVVVMQCDKRVTDLKLETSLKFSKRVCVRPKK